MRVILAMALAVGGLVGAGTHVGNDEPEPVRCTEDMACWNCETMGNRQCGPQPAHEGLAIT
jgi:hypothetical protein